MSRTACNTPVDPAAVLAWWLGELDEAEETTLETHLLECDTCTAHAEATLGLGAAIGRCFARGATAAVLSAPFVGRLAAAGLRLREYRVPCNGSVHCTVAPDDDLTIARLQAPLAGVTRLDLVRVGPDETQELIEDVPFDADAGEVIFTPNTQALRRMGDHVTRMRLIDAGGAPRVIGEYEFLHSAWKA